MTSLSRCAVYRLRLSFPASGFGSMFVGLWARLNGWAWLGGLAEIFVSSVTMTLRVRVGADWDLMFDSNLHYSEWP